ncbi:MAG: DUF1573 domain-containing protein [Bacteroidaceae bacterium]|nr:DUF1573 domain-containing protein [Bacteroidaceae bacterium]MBQ5392481.1 DUF1573 domain-containing protein [Bacteroidaceae bacterium]MBQ5912208.1 DUF1573 domain-containing protein [Bacteroidaceae bacterium]
MRKILFLACMLLMTALCMNAQSKKTVNSNVRPTGSSNAENYAEIKFDTLRYNFGIFPQSDPIRKCTFRFTNVGTAPLIINQAFASCGCTVPAYTKDPIKPGERDSINVTYNGKGLMPGRFSKTITIRSNSKTKIVRLIIEGEMTE